MTKSGYTIKLHSDKAAIKKWSFKSEMGPKDDKEKFLSNHGLKSRN